MILEILFKSSSIRGGAVQHEGTATTTAMYFQISLGHSSILKSDWERSEGERPVINA
jgi:hypothetical protein